MRAFATVYSLSVFVSALAAPVRRAASANTVLALQFAHVLEQLETEFYAQALKKFQPSDFTSAGFNDPQLVVDQLTVIAGDEATHTTVLETTLKSVGAEPITTCSFNFDAVLVDVKTTVNVARLVENVGVSAYLGAATLVEDPELLVDAASILTVEARHQTIHNLLAGGTSIPYAFDVALSPQQVLAIAGPFISGCDLGVPPNPPLTVTNKGAVTIGTQLEFDSPALNSSVPSSNFTCQMMLGGAVASIAQPISNCVVPDGIDGLVYVYITKTDQPLLNDLKVQFQADIVAGPLGVFIDTKSNKLAELISSSPIGGNPAFRNGDNNGNSTSPSPPNNDTNGDTTTFTSTTTLPASEASSLFTSTPAPTNTGPPSNVEGGPNTNTGDMGGASVLGWSSLPAGQTASPQRRSVKRGSSRRRR